LLDLREQVAARARLAVVRRSLVGVLAVGEAGHLVEGERELLGKRLRLTEPVRDRCFVGGCRRERVSGEAAAGLERHLAVRAKLAQHDLVLLGSRDRGDVREVLRRGTQHRRAADVDHLDYLRFRHAAAAGDRGEWVEADADEIEELDLVSGEGLEVLGQVAPCQDPRVDARVQCLYSASEHLGRGRHFFDTRHSEALLLEEGGSAAR